MLRLLKQQIVQTTQRVGSFSHPMRKIAYSQSRQVWMEWTWLHNNGKDEEEEEDEDNNDTKTETHKEKKAEQKSSSST